MARTFSPIAILLGCVISFALPSVAAAADGPPELRSKDGRVALKLPGGWEATELKNAKGVFQAKSDAKDAFVLVISEPKENFAYKSVGQYAARILELERAKSGLTDRTVSNPTKLKVNGADAVQYEVRGTMANGTKVVFAKTFIESPTRWNQVMCWTVPSHLQECQDDFKVLRDTLKELPARDAK